MGTNNIYRYIKIFKKEDRESYKKDYAKLESFFLELLKGEKSKASSYNEDNIQRNSLYYKDGDFYLHGEHDEKKNESKYEINLETWYFEDNPKKYGKVVFEIMTKFDFDVILGCGEGLHWAFSSIKDIDDLFEFDYLEKDDYDFHYFSEELSKKIDMSLIPFEVKIDTGKGILFLSEFFKHNADELDGEVYPMFVDQIVEEKKEEFVKEKQRCQECGSEDLIDRGDIICKKCGLVQGIKEDPNKFFSKEEEEKILREIRDEGNEAEIEYKCKHCKAKVKTTVGKGFVNQIQTKGFFECKECGKPNEDFKLKKKWKV